MYKKGKGLVERCRISQYRCPLFGSFALHRWRIHVTLNKQNKEFTQKIQKRIFHSNKREKKRDKSEVDRGTEGRERLREKEREGGGRKRGTQTERQLGARKEREGKGKKCL